MPLKWGLLTKEMEALVVKAKREEDAWWTSHGFPEYATASETGQAHPAHAAWIKAISTDGLAFSSPMARKMFVLGWLTANKLSR